MKSYKGTRPNLSGVASRNFVFRVKKCSSRAGKAVLFDYAVYVPNVIKVTSIARRKDGSVFRCLDQFLLALECRLFNTVKVSRKTGVTEEGEKEEGRE